jgi:hypothetical protein
VLISTKKVNLKIERIAFKALTLRTDLFKAEYSTRVLLSGWGVREVLIRQTDTRRQSGGWGWGPTLTLLCGTRRWMEVDCTIHIIMIYPRAFINGLLHKKYGHRFVRVPKVIAIYQTRRRPVPFSLHTTTIIICQPVSPPPKVGGYISMHGVV